MAKDSTAIVLAEFEPAAAIDVAKLGGGDPPPVRPRAPLAANAWLAVLMFLGAEAMFFAGLIGAYLVFRIGAPFWPPPFQPRLPVILTGMNTLILLSSAWTMNRALRAGQQNQQAALIRYLGVTALLGSLFLAVQGFEWLELIRFGLTVSSSVYGGLFYTLIGFHGAHVLGALVWLGVVFIWARQGRYSKANHIGLQTCRMYWNFVVALWPILYGLVYLY
ncbi:MAG: heme-copper oxidase subunit III [Deltaproteobacteria bacterium]|nr:heme-copper oxidase subunit III [Deltaproteobacteria bacterium]